MARIFAENAYSIGKYIESASIYKHKSSINSFTFQSEILIIQNSIRIIISPESPN